MNKTDLKTGKLERQLFADS